MTLFQHEEPVEVAGAGNVTIPTRDARRAARFYARVFGFEIASEARTAGTARVLMRGRGCVHLVIDERRHATAAPGRVRFEAVDLDDARERLWDLGVALAGGCIEPRFDAARDCRWLPFRDPDGNEIELVEPVARDVEAPAGRNPALACNQQAALAAISKQAVAVVFVAGSVVDSEIRS